MLLVPPRVLVIDPSEEWVLADPSACSAARADEANRGRAEGGAAYDEDVEQFGIGCYFLALTNCSAAVVSGAIAADDAARGGAQNREWWTIDSAGGGGGASGGASRGRGGGAGGGAGTARTSVPGASRVVHITEHRGSAFFDKLVPSFLVDKSVATATAMAERDWVWWRAALYQYVFRPLPHVLSSASRILERVGWPWSSQNGTRPIVALHVRSGDRGKRHVDEFLEFVLSDERVSRIVAATMTKTASTRPNPTKPTMTIFLATDDVDNIEYAQRLADDETDGEKNDDEKNDGGFSRFSLVYDPEEVREAAVVAAVAEGRMPGRDAVIAAVANLLLLSDGDLFVGSAISHRQRTYSDFSLVAALLGCASGRFLDDPVAFDLRQHSHGAGAAGGGAGGPFRRRAATNAGGAAGGAAGGGTDAGIATAGAATAAVSPIRSSMSSAKAAAAVAAAVAAAAASGSSTVSAETAAAVAKAVEAFSIIENQEKAGAHQQAAREPAAFGVDGAIVLEKLRYLNHQGIALEPSSALNDLLLERTARLTELTHVTELSRNSRKNRESRKNYDGDGGAAAPASPRVEL